MTGSGSLAEIIVVCPLLLLLKRRGVPEEVLEDAARELHPG